MTRESRHGDDVAFWQTDDRAYDDSYSLYPNTSFHLLERKDIISNGAIVPRDDVGDRVRSTHYKFLKW